MDVTIKLDGIKEALSLFDARKVQLAASSALNKIADQARTGISKDIRGEFNIKASKVKEKLRIALKSRATTMEAIISGKGRGLALSEFGAKQVGVQVNKRTSRYTKRSMRTGVGRAGGQVTVEVKRGSRKPLTGEPKPFMARTGSGHIGVWQRQGKSRLPLKQLYGPGVGHLMGSKKIMDNAMNLINSKFPSIFDHELQFYLNKK